LRPDPEILQQPYVNADGMSESGTPIRRVRWYDLIIPQAAALGVPFLLLLAAMLAAALSNPALGNVVRLGAPLRGFLGLNLLLDVSNLILLGMTLLVLSRINDPALPARLRPLSRQGVLLGLGAGLGAVVVSAAIEYLSDRYLQTNLGEEGVATAILPHSADQLLLGLFTVALLGPLTEEAYFRGLVLGWLQRHGSLGWSIGLSALLFGALHLKWLMPGGISGMVASAELVAMGVLLALVAVRTGSLWASFIAHGVNNLCAVLATFLLSH
jgi:membrane protease YdiL (CAAX protease family)